MSTMDPIVLLDVGGQMFRTRKSTLATQDDGFFRKLVSEEWVESTQTEGKALFIDRDPQCFDSVLSYLRSGKIYLSDYSSVYLAQLLDEAEFYMLDNLILSIQQELSAREEKLKEDVEKEYADTATEQPEVYKAIATHEVDDFFKRGYAYVGKFELPESASCTANSTATPMETAFLSNGACEACGTSMSYDKWLKHTTACKHTRVVVKRSKRDGDSNFNFKFAQSPFRGVGGVDFSRLERDRVVSGGGGGVGNGSTIVSPAADRTRPDSVFPLTPGNFRLDQSF